MELWISQLLIILHRSNRCLYLTRFVGLSSDSPYLSVPLGFPGFPTCSVHSWNPCLTRRPTLLRLFCPCACVLSAGSHLALGQLSPCERGHANSLHVRVHEFAPQSDKEYLNFMREFAPPCCMPKLDKKSFCYAWQWAGFLGFAELCVCPPEELSLIVCLHEKLGLTYNVLDVPCCAAQEQGRWWWGWWVSSRLT